MRNAQVTAMFTVLAALAAGQRLPEATRGVRSNIPIANETGPAYGGISGAPNRSNSGCCAGQPVVTRNARFQDDPTEAIVTLVMRHLWQHHSIDRSLANAVLCDLVKLLGWQKVKKAIAGLQADPDRQTSDRSKEAIADRDKLQADAGTTLKEAREAKEQADKEGPRELDRGNEGGARNALRRYRSAEEAERLAQKAKEECDPKRAKELLKQAQDLLRAAR